MRSMLIVCLLLSHSSAACVVPATGKRTYDHKEHWEAFIQHRPVVSWFRVSPERQRLETEFAEIFNDEGRCYYDIAPHGSDLYIFIMSDDYRGWMSLTASAREYWNDMARRF